jgi:hypothetical protein
MMAYALIISKRPFWADLSGKVVELHKWEELVASYGVITWNDVNQMDWGLIFLRRDFRKVQNRFRWKDGRIWIAEWDRTTLYVAIAIAKELGGNLQGLFGEIYYLDCNWQVQHFWPDFGLRGVVEREREKDRKNTRINRSVVVFSIILGISLVVGKEWLSPTPRSPQSEQAIRQRERDQESREKIRQDIQRGEAGEAFQRLFADDHAIYLKRAKAGDKNVRPLNTDVYKYLGEKYGSKPSSPSD